MYVCYVMLCSVMLCMCMCICTFTCIYIYTYIRKWHEMESNNEPTTIEDVNVMTPMTLRSITSKICGPIGAPCLSQSRPSNQSGYNVQPASRSNGV